MQLFIGGRIAGGLKLDGPRQIVLAYQVFTVDNRVEAGEYRVATLDLQTVVRHRVTADGLHFVERLSLPPRRYEIRYAVEQPGGEAGSVGASLVVPEWDDALSMSGIPLSSAAMTSQFMLRDEPDLRERLGGNPTSVRAFTRGNAITAIWKSIQVTRASPLTPFPSLGR